MTSNTSPMEPTLSTKIRVLLIEDNRFLRESIAEILQSRGDFAVSDHPALTASLAGIDSPDVVLLDLGLEQKDSLTLIEEIRTRYPDTRIVAMAILPDQDDIVGFVKAGGCGFILKNAPVEDYVKTIQAVARGETILPTALTKSLFAQIVDSVIASGNGAPGYATQLTKREQEVVHLISEGMSNKEIAQTLHIATFTVKSHVHNILEKLDLKSRLQIAASTRQERQE